MTINILIKTMILLLLTKPIFVSIISRQFYARRSDYVGNSINGR